MVNTPRQVNGINLEEYKTVHAIKEYADQISLQLIENDDRSGLAVAFGALGDVARVILKYRKPRKGRTHKSQRG